MSSKNNPLMVICYEQIRDKYYYGLFGEFKLIIDTETGYFNATKLCTDGNKRLCDWLRNKESKEIIKYLCEINDNADMRNLLFNTVRGGKGKINNEISGTYLPRELILSIALWISKEFYMKVYKIIENYFIQEFTEKYKNDTERLKLRVTEIENQVIEAERRNDRVELEKDNLEVERNALEALTYQYRTQNKQFQHDIAPKTSRNGELNTLVVVRKNDDGDTAYPYYAIRCQRKALGRAIRNLRQRYPKCEVAHKIAYNPNAVNLYNRAKDRLLYASTRGNHVRVVDFERFKRDLDKLIPKLIV